MSLPVFTFYDSASFYPLSWEGDYYPILETGKVQEDWRDFPEQWLVSGWAGMKTKHS